MCITIKNLQKQYYDYMDTVSYTRQMLYDKISTGRCFYANHI